MRFLLPRAHWRRVTKVGYHSFAKAFLLFRIFVIREPFSGVVCVLINWQSDMCMPSARLITGMITFGEHRPSSLFICKLFIHYPPCWELNLKRTIFHPVFSLFQTWFFTDTDDEDFQQRLNGRLINTKCPKGHSRRALCCKMAAELNTFLEHRKKWVWTIEIYGRRWRWIGRAAHMWPALRFNFQ